MRHISLDSASSGECLGGRFSQMSRAAPQFPLMSFLAPEHQFEPRPDQLSQAGPLAESQSSGSTVVGDGAGPRGPSCQPQCSDSSGADRTAVAKEALLRGNLGSSPGLINNKGGQLIAVLLLLFFFFT